MSYLSITTIQTNLFWQDKKANLQMFENKINAINENTEIVILPEMFSTGFTMQPQLFSETMEGETIEWMKEISSKKKIILIGSIIINENDFYFNRLIWMLPNGNFGYYDKRHLFTLANEDKYFKAGNKRLIASVKGWKINLQICYDLRFPLWARQKSTLNTANKALEYDVLIYVANWPQTRNHAWEILLSARAIENQCYVIGVNRIGKDGNNINYNGNTLVINPLGQILYNKFDEEDTNTISLSKETLNEIRLKFPFWHDADDFSFM